jgi:predicted flap endonuclease-1-like 5' DNA nuclease
MKHEAKQLKKLRGIGEVLARRFFEAGYDTVAKVASADVEDLKKIPGVNPRMLQHIVAQASMLSEEAPKSRYENI